ncbi:hypothetical protein ACOMHN_056045 [Nucella lapillus]
MGGLQQKGMVESWLGGLVLLTGLHCCVQLERLSELEDTVAEQENTIAALHDKVKVKEEEVIRLRAQMAVSEKHIKVEKQKLKQEQTDYSSKRTSEADDLHRVIGDQKKEMAVLQEEIAVLKESHTRGPTASMKNLVDRLKNQLALKEKQHQALSKALTELRADMVAQAQGSVMTLSKALTELRADMVAQAQGSVMALSKALTELRADMVAQAQGSALSKALTELRVDMVAQAQGSVMALSKALTELRADMVAQAQGSVMAQAEEAQQERNIQRLVEAHTKDMAEQLEDVQAQVERSKRELKKRKESEGLLQTELEDVKEELGRKDRANTKLRTSKAKLETEVDELERKVERLSSHKTQKTGDFERMQELEDMRRRNRYLEDELKKRHTAEKPYEQKEDKAKMEEALRWEEGKKWQRTIDKMKSKIKEKDEEIEKLSRTVERLKATLDRTSREKDALETRGKGLQKTTVSALSAAPPSRGPDHDKEDLRQLNYRLQEENRELKKQALMSQDAAFKEVQMRNIHLREQVEQLERALAHRPKDGGVEVQEYQRLFGKNQELQKEVLRLSEEAMELRFETEASRKDIPRMKERISDLQKYVEALKQENAQLSGDSARSAASSIRRVGESGKSTRELEKTISLLKKVVERVQQENQRLKTAPGPATADQMALLQRDNQGLKSQLEELRQHMGATLSERYTSQQKGTAKMMNDYEQMRKDLAKEREGNEKLRIQVRNLELRGEQNDRELLDTRTRLEIEAAKRPSSTSMASDQQGWKSAVQTRIYEEKIKGLEDDCHRKTKQIGDMKTKQMSDMKVLLRDAAEREQSLLQDKDQLQQKLAVVERFPAGSQVTDSNIMREFQQARLQIERLENEKKELANDLRLAQQQAGGGEQVSSDTLMKARKYEDMAKENVEARLEVKAITLDNHKLKMEVNKLKKELESFGPDFFEEIEDLKYNYKQTVERCALLEDKLRTLARQFGVSVGVPGIN